MSTPPPGPLTVHVVLLYERSAFPDLPAALRSVIARLDADSSFSGAVTINTPIARSRIGRLIPWRSTSRRLRAAMRSGLAGEPRVSGSRVCLGVLVVDNERDRLSGQIEEIRRSPRLTTLPLQVRGVLFGVPGRALPSGVVAVDPATSPIQLDRVIYNIVIEILSDADVTRASANVSDLAKRLGFSPAPANEEPEITATPFPEDGRAAMVLPDVAGLAPSHEAPATVTGYPGRYKTAGQRLRMTYIVVDTSKQSRTKQTRQRLTALASQLDHALAPVNKAFESRTWIVGAGRGAEHRVLLTTGHLTSKDVPRASQEFLDLTQTMAETLRLVREDRDSFGRRGQELMTPLVAFILPAGRVIGPRCVEYYQELSDIANVGWIATDRDTLPTEVVDPARYVLDKDDAVNELVTAMGLGKSIESIAADHDLIQASEAPRNEAAKHKDGQPTNGECA